MLYDAAKQGDQPLTLPARAGRVRVAEWKSLLDEAAVRDARLYARHTAATMLRVLTVPLPAIMEVMGWAEASVAKRYVHVPDEVILGIAGQVEELLWTAKPAGGPARKALTAEKRKALLEQFSELLSDEAGRPCADRLGFLLLRDLAVGRADRI